MKNKILIVGLGNPGSKYENTRHNLGFMVLDKLAKRLLPVAKSQWQMDKESKALVLRVNSRAVLLKPQTFMNSSGYAVERIKEKEKIATSSLWVIHDDVDLPLGKIKIRIGGASAGHHGVDSIIKQIGSDLFLRFRLGVGRPDKSEDRKAPGTKAIETYVLENFLEKEAGALRRTLSRTVKAIELALDKGPEKAMNRFN